MKKKKFFKNKVQMVIYIILFIVCFALFIIIGRMDFEKHYESDAEKFNSLYNLVEKDNIYTFSNATDVLNIINGRSGVILLGFSSNKWTNYTAKILNETAKEVGLTQIYYYDFLQDRKASNGTYETIVNNLSAYVPINDLGRKDIQAPAVLIVKNGQIIAYFDDTAIMRGIIDPKDYYTETEIEATKAKFKMALSEYIK